MQPKIPPIRVASDDCVLTTNGMAYPLHRGEWVELLRVESFAVSHHLRAMLQAVADQALQDAHYDALCRLLAERVVAWNWTGLQGQPLPAPTWEVIRDLTTSEILWLYQAVMGETEGERKNALRPSVSISPGAAPSRKKRRFPSSARNSVAPPGKLGSRI